MVDISTAVGIVLIVLIVLVVLVVLVVSVPKWSALERCCRELSEDLSLGFGTVSVVSSNRASKTARGVPSVVYR